MVPQNALHFPFLTFTFERYVLRAAIVFIFEFHLLVFSCDWVV